MITFGKSLFLMFDMIYQVGGNVQKKILTFNILFPWVISGYVLMVLPLWSIMICKGVQPLLPPDGSFGYYFDRID